MTTQTPKLRFPEFADEWEVKKFGEIFTFRTTNSFSRDNLNYEFGSVKNIHYGDIHTKFKTQFSLINELVPFVNEEINIDKIPADNYCKVGDLVIADASEDYADIGKSIEIRNLNNEKTIAGLHTFLARPDLFEMSLGFNGYIMQSRNIRLQIMTIAQGTKVLSLSTGRLANVDLNIPSLPEQTKIANFLSAIDEKIQALKQKKTLLEQYKKGIMQQIFSQQLRFKNDDGADFDDWEEKSLGEICKITIGEFVIRTKQNPNGKYPVFNGGKTYTGLYDEYNNEGNKIIISARGANAGFVNFQSEKYWAGNSCYSIGVKDEKIHSIKYFFFYVKMFENRFLENQQAANIPSVSKKDAEMFEIEIPSLPEQTKIANFLTAIDEKIEKVSQQISTTETYKKGLLQAMFC
jgi:type I restriction enzyme S subunit